jgi:hypothetical protein
VPFAKVKGQVLADALKFQSRRFSFVKNTNFLDRLNDHLLFKEGLVPWNTYNARWPDVWVELAVVQFPGCLPRPGSRRSLPTSVKTYINTRPNFMDRSPSSEANSRSTTQIPLFLWNPKTRVCEHDGPVLSLMPEPDESSPHSHILSSRFILIECSQLHISPPSGHFRFSD